MFEPNISELQSSLNGTNPLLSGEIDISKTEPFLGFNPQSQLALNSGFDVEYINQTLDKTTLVNSEAFGNSVSGTNQLTTQGINDSLTGMSADTSLVGMLDSFSQTSNNTSTLLSSPSPSALGTYIVRGSLGADRFTIASGYNYVISGNGNVNFGSGYRDYIDLSGIFSSSVAFNYVSPTGSGGVLYNPGNGTRLFDSMTLSNGSQILFEGVDSIRFADGTVNLFVKPNDPLFDSQWNLQMMGVHNAWYFTQGSSKILIGVQDTGLGINSSGNIHSDLGQTYFYSNNLRDEFLEGGQLQSLSHGTAVQGIIAARGNNGIGLSGINWNSDVFNIDVLGGNLYDQSLAQATQNMINFANSGGQKLIVNMSLGGGSRDSVFEQLIANNQNNALFVIASGNDDQNSLSYPAWLSQSYDNVISVGASWGTRDINGNSRTPGTRISYPNWWGSNYGNGLTLMGPSEVITNQASPTFNPNIAAFGYDNDFNGTSAATPNVAGVASLVWSVNRNLTAGQIKQVLSQTAYDLGAQGYDYIYGNGFVNADAAVRRALAIKRTGSFSAFSSLPINDSISSELDNPLVNEGKSTVISDGRTIAQNQLVDVLENLFNHDIDVTEAVESSQFIPIYSVSENSLTPITNIASVAGLDSSVSDTLAPGLKFDYSLGQNSDDLMLVYS